MTRSLCDLESLGLSFFICNPGTTMPTLQGHCEDQE